MIKVKKGIIATCASAILFGATPLLTTMIYSYDIDTMTTVFYRSVFAIILSALLCAFQHVSLRITAQQLKDLAITAILGSGLTTILLFQSYAYIDTGSATGLHFLYPLFVAISTRLFFNEPLTKRKICALLLACVAMLLFLSDNNAIGFRGYGLAISSAITYAFYIIYSEQKHLTDIEPFKLSFYLALFTAIQTLCFHLFQPQLRFFIAAACLWLSTTAGAMLGNIRSHPVTNRHTFAFQQYRRPVLPFRTDHIIACGNSLSKRIHKFK